MYKNSYKEMTLPEEIVAFWTSNNIKPRSTTLKNNVVVLRCSDFGSWGIGFASLKYTSGKYKVLTKRVYRANHPIQKFTYTFDYLSEALECFYSVSPISKDQLFNDPNYYGV